MSTQLLPDEVWQHLDPRAARLGRRPRRLVLATVVVGALIGLGTVLGMSSGLLTPQLEAQGGGGEATANSHVVTSSLHLRNAGWFAEHIDAVDVTTPNFTVVRTHGAGITIAPDRTRTVSVVVRIENCAQVTRDTDFAIALRLRRFWGAKTETFSGASLTQLPWDSCHRA